MTNMNQYKKIAVAMDASLMDDRLLQFLKVWCDIFVPEKVFFFHAFKDHPVQKLMHQVANVEYKDPIVDEMVSIEKFLNNNVYKEIWNMPWELEMVKSTKPEDIISFLEEREINLLITGNKDQVKSRYFNRIKLVHDLDCSIIFVPEKPVEKISNIIAAIDLSSSSKDALKSAIEIRDAANSSEAVCLNYVFDPAPLGLTATRNLALEKMMEVINSNYTENQNLVLEPKQNINYLEAGITEKLAEDINADLIVVGPSRKSGIDRLLIGSFTKSLLKKCKSVPVMIAKKS